MYALLIISLLVTQHALNIHCRGSHSSSSSLENDITHQYVEPYESDELVEDDSECRKIAMANYVESTPLSECDYASSPI